VHTDLSCAGDVLAFNRNIEVSGWSAFLCALTGFCANSRSYSLIYIRAEGGIDGWLGR
jgi:hypothetical protein